MVSASIAYYGILSIFPLMLLLVSLSGIYIRHFELNGRLAIVLERYLPMKPDFILRNLVSISQSYGRVSLVSGLLLLWSSSGVFLPIELALNRAWGVEKRRSWWRRHLLALEMALVLGVLVLISTVLVGLNVNVHEWLHRFLRQPAGAGFEFVYHLMVSAVSFGMTLGMFVVLFERLPNRPMRISQVIPSAFLTALFWEGARSLFTLLLPHFNYHQVYGSIGFVVALMSWAYISSAVMLFGADVSSALYGTLKTPVPVESPVPVPVLQSTIEAR